MTISISKSQFIRWELKDFYNQWQSNKEKDIISDSFNMGSASFAFFYNTTHGLYQTDYWPGNSYGVILKDRVGKESVEVRLNLWFENEEGQNFQRSLIGKYIFKKVEDRCKFNVHNNGNDRQSFSNVFDNNKTLYICCNLTVLNDQATVPVADSTQQLHQGMWSIYEQGVHDAVIKVGNTEFKILKSQFTACSNVFKQMFTLGFKEGKTNTVEIKDVSEKTMDQMIRWMYTCQIDDESSIEDLFEAADKYQIHLLKTRCAELMINSLDNSNVFRRLILAVAHNDQQLKDFALRHIGTMSVMEVAAYFTSSEWTELVQKKSIFVNEVNKLICDKLKK